MAAVRGTPKKAVADVAPTAAFRRSGGTAVLAPPVQAPPTAPVEARPKVPVESPPQAPVKAPADTRPTALAETARHAAPVATPVDGPERPTHALPAAAPATPPIPALPTLRAAPAWPGPSTDPLVLFTDSECPALRRAVEVALGSMTAAQRTQIGRRADAVGRIGMGGRGPALSALRALAGERLAGALDLVQALPRLTSATHSAALCAALRRASVPQLRGLLSDVDELAALPEAASQAAVALTAVAPLPPPRRTAAIAALVDAWTALEADVGPRERWRGRRYDAYAGLARAAARGDDLGALARLARGGSAAVARELACHWGDAPTVRGAALAALAEAISGATEVDPAAQVAGMALARDSGRSHEPPRAATGA